LRTTNQIELVKKHLEEDPHISLWYLEEILTI
jgi:hypothetical protein